MLHLVVPSGLWMAGLWMASYAASGMMGGLSFGVPAVLTGVSMAMGWRTAMKRKFPQYRRWVLHYDTLLCSAVVFATGGWSRGDV